MMQFIVVVVVMVTHTHIVIVIVIFLFVHGHCMAGTLGSVSVLGVVIVRRRRRMDVGVIPTNSVGQGC